LGERRTSNIERRGADARPLDELGSNEEEGVIERAFHPMPEDA